MYFWSIKKLKTQIIENNFNEKDRLKYFFLTNSLMLLYFFFWNLYILKVILSMIKLKELFLV